MGPAHTLALNYMYIHHMYNTLNGIKFSKAHNFHVKWPRSFSITQLKLAKVFINQNTVQRKLRQQSFRREVAIRNNQYFPHTYIADDNNAMVYTYVVHNCFVAFVQPTEESRNAFMYTYMQMHALMHRKHIHVHVHITSMSLIPGILSAHVQRL